MNEEDINIEMLIELLTISMQGAEDTDFNTLFRVHCSIACVKAQKKELRAD